MVVEIQPEDFINEELRMESGELAAQQNEQLLALNPSLSSSQLSMFTVLRLLRQKRFLRHSPHPLRKGIVRERLRVEASLYLV